MLYPVRRKIYKIAIDLWQDIDYALVACDDFLQAEEYAEVYAKEYGRDEDCEAKVLSITEWTPKCTPVKYIGMGRAQTIFILEHAVTEFAEGWEE